MNTFTTGEYITRDGYKAVVLTDNAPSPTTPLIGYVEDPLEAPHGDVTCCHPYAWQPSGAAAWTRPDGFDLIAPWPIPVTLSPDMSQAEAEARGMA